jgi:hypothetical protein
MLKCMCLAFSSQCAPTPLCKHTQALRSSAEEYGLVLDIMQRYAVYSTGVGISLKRHGEVRCDVNTQAAETRLDAIKAVYGACVYCIQCVSVKGGGTCVCVCGGGGGHATWWVLGGVLMSGVLTGGALIGWPVTGGIFALW